MVRQAYRCRLCQQVGHNARTCKKVVTAPPTQTHTTQPYPHVSSTGGQTVTGEGTTSSDIATAFVAVDREIAQETPQVEAMTAEEIQTWWILTSGRTGKREQGKRYTLLEKRKLWNEDDHKNLMRMLTTAVDQNTSEKALKRFLNTFGARAKHYLCLESNLPKEILAVLAKDSSVSTRRFFLKARIHHAPLPKNVLDGLLTDQDPEVRSLLCKYYPLTGAQLQEMWDARFPTFKNHSEKWRVSMYRRELVRNENCPLPVLMDNVGEDAWLRHAGIPQGAIANRQMTSASLEKIFYDSYSLGNSYGQRARVELLAVPAMKEKFLAQTLDGKIKDRFDSTPFQSWETTEEAYSAVLRNPALSSALLHRAAHYADDSLHENTVGTRQLYVLDHPNVSTDTIKFLCDDGVSIRVRERAKEKLEKRLRTQ